MIDALINLAAATAYFYFNWRYFAWTSAVLRLPRRRNLPVVGAFFLNYGLFVLCSILELNLIVNWALFFLLLWGETQLYCRCGWRASLYFSLSGILYGLTVNIFCRCAVAIAISQPLTAFDNHITSVGNLKALPVFLGFVLGGAVLHAMAGPRRVEKVQTLIDHPRHLAFQLELMAGMFLYLFLNLLLYQSGGNSVLLKLWGIKSCVFSLVGSHLGLRYALQMCRLSDYREKNRAIQRELLQHEREEEKLRSIAYRDVLTGVYNRQYALDELERLLQAGAPFALCFLDLDDLKGVNDRHGHAEGDRYLLTVARELAHTCRQEGDLLARYGGDEFLLLCPGAAAATIEARMQQVDQRLQALSREGAVPFPMSVSYGAVDGGQAHDRETLMRAADDSMYRRKRAKADSPR